MDPTDFVFSQRTWFDPWPCAVTLTKDPCLAEDIADHIQPEYPAFISFDFWLDPSTSALQQIQQLPSGTRGLCHRWTTFPGVGFSRQPEQD